MSALLSLPTRPSSQRAIPTVEAAGVDLAESRATVQFVHHGAIWSLELQACEEVSVLGLTGSFWATFDNDPVDHVVEPGGRRVFSGPGRLVLEGLQNENSASLTIPSVLEQD